MRSDGKWARYINPAGDVRNTAAPDYVRQFTNLVFPLGHGTEVIKDCKCELLNDGTRGTLGQNPVVQQFMYMIERVEQASGSKRGAQLRLGDLRSKG